MSDSQPSLVRPLLLIAALLIVGLVVYWRLSGSPGSIRGGPAGSGPEASGQGSFAEPEVIESRSARRRADGGAPGARVAGAVEAEGAPPPEGAYDPPLPTLGVEEPMHRVDPDAPPPQPPPSRNTEPLTPEQELGRTVFWRGMLDGRIAEINQQLEQAEELGDDRAARRARRMLERLEAQRPVVEERIRELQERSPDVAPDER